LAVACRAAIFFSARKIADGEINRLYHVTAPPQKPDFGARRVISPFLEAYCL
jgi:hypothetical protein